MVSEDSDWHVEDNKHYCPKCFGGFDDNLIINLKTKKDESNK